MAGVWDADDAGVDGIVFVGRGGELGREPEGFFVTWGQLLDDDGLMGREPFW